MAPGAKPGKGFPTPSLLSASLTLCFSEELERSKQSAALGLPMPGASWPTSLQKFQASKATLKPSLLIPGSPTAVSRLAPETPSTITFTNKNTTCKWASMAISTRVLCSALP
ncbi:hypothetical protein OIU76_007799 [Salix suchowensis]|nr:hypothetical protein OIU76_007799 [Salix suchowensis]